MSRRGSHLSDASQQSRAEENSARDAGGLPRVLIVPPPAGVWGVDIDDQLLARSLVTDVTLTLCKSHLYEVIAPFTAGQLTRADQQLEPADYVVVTDLEPCSAPIPYAALSVEVLATEGGKSLFSSQIELHSGLLQDVHQSLCSVLAEQICGRIGVEELARFRRGGAASAYVHYLIAVKRNERSDLFSLRRAQKSLTRSIALSPDFVPALSQLARTKTLEWLERGSADRMLLEEALHLAQRANRYEPNDSASLREIGHATLYLRDLGGALERYQEAQALAPNHADLLADQADVLTHLSRHDEAEMQISHALSLNPLAPDDYYWIGGAVCFFRGEYERGLGRLRTMRSPGLAFRLMAACAAMTNDMDAARSYRDQALARDPSFTIGKWSSLYPEPSRDDANHYFSALKLAGFPQGS